MEFDRSSEVFIFFTLAGLFSLMCSVHAISISPMTFSDDLELRRLTETECHQVWNWLTFTWKEKLSISLSNPFKGGITRLYISSLSPQGLKCHWNAHATPGWSSDYYWKSGGGLMNPYYLSKWK